MYKINQILVLVLMMQTLSMSPNAGMTAANLAHAEIFQNPFLVVATLIFSLLKQKTLFLYDTIASVPL